MRQRKALRDFLDEAGVGLLHRDFWWTTWKWFTLLRIFCRLFEIGACSSGFLVYELRMGQAVRDL